MNNHSYGSKVPQNPNFGDLNRHFKPNMRKIQIAISSDRYQIDMKFDRQLRPATGTSWAVSYGGKTFQDSGRLPFWKSIYRHISVKNHPIFMTWSKNENAALDRLRVRQNVFLVLKQFTLLLSAKCTCPLFQGRTGCGGRPSGWYDIVTCQRLVMHVAMCY